MTKPASKAKAKPKGKAFRNATQRVVTLVSAEEKAIIEAFARTEKRTVSEYIRRVALEGATASALQDLRDAVSRLETLVAHANAGKPAP